MKHTPRSWLWPDHVIGMRESSWLRAEHNATVNQHAELLAALESLRKELWAAGLKLNVRKHFSLLAADAAAGTAIHKAKGGA